MTWAPVLQWAGISAFGLMVLITTRPRRKNKRAGLPAPRPDERNSIEQFKRIVQ